MGMHRAHARKGIYRSFYETTGKTVGKPKISSVGRFCSRAREGVAEWHYPLSRNAKIRRRPPSDDGGYKSSYLACGEAGPLLGPAAMTVEPA
jgi:hypothetical protein